MPSAPASISRRERSHIRSVSAGVGFLFWSPTTCSRRVPDPMKEATLGDIPRFSRWARYSARVVHAYRISGRPAGESRCFISSFSGPLDCLPHDRVSPLAYFALRACQRAGDRDHGAVDKSGARRSPGVTDVFCARASRSADRRAASPLIPTRPWRQSPPSVAEIAVQMRTSNLRGVSPQSAAARHIIIITAKSVFHV